MQYFLVYYMCNLYALKGQQNVLNLLPPHINVNLIVSNIMIQSAADSEKSDTSAL